MITIRKISWLSIGIRILAIFYCLYGLICFDYVFARSYHFQEIYWNLHFCIFSVVSLLCFAIGFGVFLYKNWARLLLIFGNILILFSVCLIYMMFGYQMGLGGHFIFLNNRLGYLPEVSGIFFPIVIISQIFFLLPKVKEQFKPKNMLKKKQLIDIFIIVCIIVVFYSLLLIHAKQEYQRAMEEYQSIGSGVKFVPDERTKRLTIQKQ